MNAKAKLIGAPGYIKEPNRTRRSREAQDWKREHEVSRYR